MILFFLFLSVAAPAESAGRGKTVYDDHCAECHGPAGRGDGPAAAFLAPRPRDFTSGKFKIRSTETGTLPTDDDLIASWIKPQLTTLALPHYELGRAAIELLLDDEYSTASGEPLVRRIPMPLRERGSVRRREAGNGPRDRARLVRGAVVRS